MGAVPRGALACSLHFLPEDFEKFGRGTVVRLKEGAVPTQNLPKGSFQFSPCSEKKRSNTARSERLQKRRLNFENTQKNCTNVDFHVLDHSADSLTSVDTPAIVHNVDFHVLDHSADSLTSVDTPAIVHNFPNWKCVSCQTELYETTCTSSQTDEYFVEQVKDGTCKMTDILCSDKAMNTCAGVSSLAQFNALCESVEYVTNVMNASIRYKLDSRSRVLLTLMKLKLDLTFRCIACFFETNEKSVTEYFFLTIDILHSILKQFIVWLPQETIRDSLPVYFEMFSDTRAVLDCAEVGVQISRCLNCSVRTYSYYKGKNTLKFLVVVAPDGCIIFVSPMYGGRASDKFIVNDSKVLDKCEPNSAIMVDKGFDIAQECTNRNLTMHQPPFFDAQKKQFTAEEVEKCRNIARARVHVERTIQRIRLFRILKTQFPWSLLHYADKILTITCALVNLSPPILGEERFQSFM